MKPSIQESTATPTKNYLVLTSPPRLSTGSGTDFINPIPSYYMSPINNIKQTLPTSISGCTPPHTHTYPLNKNIPISPSPPCVVSGCVRPPHAFCYILCGPVKAFSVALPFLPYLHPTTTSDGGGGRTMSLFLNRFDEVVPSGLFELGEETSKLAVIRVLLVGVDAPLAYATNWAALEEATHIDFDGVQLGFETDELPLEFHLCCFGSRRADIIATYVGQIYLFC